LIPHFWRLDHQQQHQERKKGKQWNEEEKENLEAKGGYPSFLLYVGCGKAVLTLPRRQLLEKSFFSSVPPRTGRQKSVTIWVSMV
jgi:hypothetical protein